MTTDGIAQFRDHYREALEELAGQPARSPIRRAPPASAQGGSGAALVILNPNGTQSHLAPDGRTA
ncbi:hypothetical protein GTV15_05690, partial [Streptomyces sp. SID7803]|nr:hypothetical protein [Streptomyces sp. SID7803]